MNIDTTNQQYQQYLNALPGLRDLMLPRLKILGTLPKAKQEAWLQRDLLLRRLIKMARLINKEVNVDHFGSEIDG